MINKVILLGNLGKEPDVKTFSGGGKLVNLTIATSSGYKDKQGNWQEKAEWHNVVVFGNTANFAEKLRKGEQVYVEGSIETSTHEGQDGTKKYYTNIKAMVLKSLSPKEKGSGGSRGSNQAERPAPHREVATMGQSDQGDFLDGVDDDTLPF